jgi:hypothetical protein
MRNRILALLAAPLIFAVSVCATHAGQTVDLHGKLVLRGNVPFVKVVVLSGNDVWQLEGVPLERASSLQNRQVDIHGVVIRDRPEGSELPAVQVQSLTEATDS